MLQKLKCVALCSIFGLLSACAKRSAEDKKKQNPSIYLNILKGVIERKGE